jgi:hypothetical protein
MKLFEPCELGGLRLPNRIVMAPMTRNRAIGTVAQEMAVRPVGFIRTPLGPNRTRSREVQAQRAARPKGARNSGWLPAALAFGVKF